MGGKRDRILAKSGGKCWYCGCDLSGTRWQADHFHPLVRYGDGDCAYPEMDTEKNLVPSCAPCNNYKSSHSIEGLRYAVSNLRESTLKQSTGLRMLYRMGLVLFNEEPVQFWFEKSGFYQASMDELLGISPEAQAVKWEDDHADKCKYATIAGAMVTVRCRGNGAWLAIATRANWDQSRLEFDAGNRVALQVAAQWALTLGSA